MAADSLHVGNLPHNITKEVLKKYFARFGAIDYVVRPYDKILRKFCNYGFVAYKHMESLITALSQEHSVRKSCWLFYCTSFFDFQFHNLDL